MNIPFQYEQELAEKSKRLVALDAELNMEDSRQEEKESSVTKQEKISAKGDKPSILDGLKIHMVESNKCEKKGKSAEWSLE